jgi:hypothetical protein
MKKDDNTPSGGEEEKRGPGRPREELPGIGDNIKGLTDDIEKAFEKVDQFGNDREAINKKVQAVREDLYAKGIPKEAFDLARAYKSWPEDKRRNFDLAFAVCRDAIGMPMQADFLEKLG